jgi:putative transposase
MGSVGDAYDNAMWESFFATLECELLGRCRFKTQTEARSAVFAFIEGFYNPRRRHSSIGYLSPIDYEHRHHAATSIATHTSLPPCSRPSRTGPSGGRSKRPSLTSTARGSRVSARVGTEEWLRRGPN